MSASSPTLHLGRLDAVLFDIDDVLVDTALLHAAAWQHTLDDYLRRRGAKDGLDLPPFDLPADYLRYAEGRPSAAGVRGFLTARGVSVPEFSANPDDDTVRSLSSRKDDYFLAQVDRVGVSAYASSVELLRELSRRDIRVAAVAAGHTCLRVLEAAGVASLFDLRVDGEDAALLRLPARPDPALLLEATHRLGVSPRRTGVVAGGLAGVEAAWNGCFEPIVAVDRYDHKNAFYQLGAHVVVRDLGELLISGRGRQELLAHR